MLAVEILDWSLHTMRDRVAELEATYEMMYRMVPGSGAGFGTTLAPHSQRSGFRLCVARDRAELVGFGYGFTGMPGQPWRDCLAAIVGEPAATQWLTGHFELAEFGVVPTRHRQGIGTQLHTTILHGLPQPHAVLTVRTNNAVARQFYAGNGWRALYHDFRTRSGAGPYIVMRRALSRR